MKNTGDILAGILNKYSNCYIFLHNTKEIGIVERIFREGFIFEDQLPHSTDKVNPNEPIEVIYFLFQRKDYGRYTIIIAIPKTVYDNYMKFSIQNDLDLEEVLTIKKPYYGDNDEFIYTISPKHILGYFNSKTGEFFDNNNYDPDFDATQIKTWLNECSET